MTTTETLSASLEDYLEAILHIIRQKQAARAKDISKRLKVSSSSVTGALHSLAERQLINYEPYDVITLTAKGMAVAKDVVHRHEVLRDFFVKVLAVGEADADEAACLIEHAVQPTLMERFIQFVKFVETCPRLGLKWISEFGYHCDNGNIQEDCERCIALILEEAKKKKVQRGGAE